MQPHAAERRHLGRQLTLARPVFLVLALLDLLVISAGPVDRGAVAFVATYLGFAVLLALLEGRLPVSEWDAPMLADIIALLLFLPITPSVVAFWFLFLFVAFAVGTLWGMRRVVLVVLLGAAGLVARLTVTEIGNLQHMVSSLALGAGTLVAGVAIGYLGQRQRHHAAEQEFLAELAGRLQVEIGVAESLRRLLLALADEFGCEGALLAMHDREVGRVFVWKARRGEESRIAPETFPEVQRDAFLLDAPEASVAWNSLDGAGNGFGWDRKDGRPLTALPRPPHSTMASLGLRSLLAATLEMDGRGEGKLLLYNGERAFSAGDLRWLEGIARHLSAPLKNLFLLRLLRARAIETERNRISHDLHDGILQSLLSFDMRLDVLRRRMPPGAEPTAAELVELQQMLRGEAGELRRIVSDMRPLRVESADLRELMRGFGERFRQESGLALELLTEDISDEVPERVCRELFQIYREALHNVKKHAQATHVVVKLSQDEARVRLVVDDNGRGFSFAGRFSSDELDRLRLGPISIKERTRSMGGMLTIESTPGHGARLTVDVPLN